MRIISSEDPKYNPGGYHFGSVWPLFTGWAAVGEYRYHRALPAYSNLRANALLALNGSLGHVTEVLSGDYFEPLSTSSPHQIWSAAMVTSPLLRGMLGLSTNAGLHTIALTPHLPYNWSSFSAENVAAGDCRVGIEYHRTIGEITLDIHRSGSGMCTIDFSPAVSLNAKVIEADVNGRKVPVHLDKSSVDQHAGIRFPVSVGTSKLHISLRDDFGLFCDSQLPPLGGASEGLRVVSESWTADGSVLRLDLSGRAGHTYELGLWNAALISGIEGATLDKTGGTPHLKISFPGSNRPAYVHTKVSLRFGGRRGYNKRDFTSS
jgi:hypothetical protein